MQDTHIDPTGDHQMVGLATKLISSETFAVMFSEDELMAE